MSSGQQVTKFIFETTNLLKIQDFLDQNPDFDPRIVLDKKQNNIIHHLSFHDHKDLIKLYINHTAKLIKTKTQASKDLYKKDPKQEIANWINQKNEQGFTPLLYASFNGHVELIYYLLEMGANPAISNNTKLNVLHMAAQNNKVSTLICFRGKVDYNLTDQKGSTPLHWASYSGSQEAAAYLLTLEEVKIDIVDNDGQTPLFLATFYGNTKIVRRLLMKGANRRIKNNRGQKPIQIAQENEFRNITKMLDDKYSCCDFLKFYYNVKLQYKPQSRSYVIPIVFLLTSICCLLILNGLLKFTKLYFYIGEGVVIGIMLLLYISLLTPPKTQDKQNIKLYINETKKICFECVKKKPKRSYHCDICKVCISQYDHHCTWINNCVGKRNIARFVIFIFFLLLSLGILGLTATCGFLKETFFPNFAKQFIELRERTDTQFQRWAKIVLFSFNMIVSLFWFPLFLLFALQIKNLCMNKTTYQRFRGDNSSVRDQLKQRRKRGPSLANCKAMCSNTNQSFSSDHSMDEQLLSTN